MSPRQSSLHANETFKGTENPILMRNFFQVDFICSFDNIKLYPFDEESCQLKFYISGADNDLTNLNAGQLSVFTPSLLGDYEIRRWTL